ncbi:MAG: hypothetical protein LBO78_02020 [Rickettsiales bacterium]|jgi:hypothetical protein|nr:hypothetical protein [Rickettsiales bacterium]
MDKRYFIGDQVYVAYFKDGSSGVFEGRVRSIDLDPSGRVIYEVGSLGFFFAGSLFSDKAESEEHLGKSAETAAKLAALRDKMGKPGTDESLMKSEWEAITEEAYGKPEFPELAKK